MSSRRATSAAARLVRASATAMARGRRVEHGDGRAFAHGHGFAAEAFVVGQRHGAVGHRHLPRADHLVAAGEPAHGAIADGDEEGLVGHGGVAQHAVGGFGQVDAGQVQRGRHARQALDVARHARRLAQDHVDGHIHRTHFIGALRADGVQARQALAVDHAQLALFGGHAHHRVGTALAARDGVEAVQVLRQDRQDVALLRFVAPDLGRRQA